MNPTAKKIQWVVELIIQEQPCRLSEVIERTGFKRHDVEDAIYDLYCRGVIKLRADSYMEWIV